MDKTGRAPPRKPHGILTKGRPPRRGCLKSPQNKVTAGGLTAVLTGRSKTRPEGGRAPGKTRQGETRTMDETAEKKCMCGARRTGRLMTPGEEPAGAGERLLAERDQDHTDARLGERYWSIFGFAILNRATAGFLRDHAPTSEAGPGTGYWARELQDAGIDEAASGAPGRGRRPGGKTWTEVESSPRRRRLRSTRRGTCSSAGRRRRSGSAPETGRSTWGEPRGGCAGTPGMFREIRRAHLTRGAHEIPRFAGNGDRLHVMSRREIRGASTPPPG